MSFVFSLFIVRQKYLSHHMYLHTNLKLRSTNYAPVWGCLCATSIAIGWTVIFIIQPEFLTDLDARQQLINKHSALLILWYIIDWLVFGLSLAFDFDVYLSDEATAVGDLKFRQKAIQAFKDRIGQSSLIIVSHAEGILKELCQAGILLRNGEAEWYDDIHQALNAYHS